MPTTLETRANEESTFIITVSFLDEDNSSVTPTAITWTLTDKDGNIINSREDVSISTGTSVDVVLTGDDLSLQSTESKKAKRVLTISATYNSDAGTGLSLKDEVTFYVTDLVAVS